MELKYKKMTKKKITELLTNNYTSFVEYIKNLKDEDFLFINNGKWTAGQQLKHIVICVKPILQVFSMPKIVIEQNFGLSNRKSVDYNNLIVEYLVKLKEGGKAPSRFLPETVEAYQKVELCETLINLISSLNLKIDTFSEEELDKYFIPHPLLGNLTLREMLYNVIYHVEHHKDQTKKNLSTKNS